MRTLILCLCVLAGSVRAFGQTPYLEKTVSLKAGTYTYDALFKSLSQQTGVVFSYTNFNSQEKTTITTMKKPLRVVLNTLFNDGSCRYRLKGKYVILSCPSKPKAATDVQLNGYVYNAEDSTLLASTSVYLKQNKRSAITNDFGYFTLAFPKTSDVLSISVAKELYKDTTIVLYSRARQTVVIYLEPEVQPTAIVIDSVMITLHTGAVDSLPQDEMTSPPDTLAEPIQFWRRLTRTNSNLQNIRDTLVSNVAVAFVPGISTNHFLAINTVNRFAFNMIGGYSKGIGALELAGVFNIDHGNVQYVQAAGVTNIVSGDVRGVQLAGAVNAVSGKSVTGVQAAGLVNVNRGKMRYVQLAGIGNTVLDSVAAWQSAGIYNVNKTHTFGVQAAGVYNQTHTLQGVQLAGIANQIRRYGTGVQVAGIANNADSLSGVQIAGLTNNARYIKGFQLAGLINRAEHVHGSQLSVINVAQSVSGVPIGLFSYVHNGYHKIELATDENLLTTIGFRTGVERFHNIFFAGLQLSGASKTWTYGYGVGSAAQLGKNLHLNFDLTSQQLERTGSSSFSSMNILNKGYIGLEYRIVPKISIAVGPTFNFLTADTSGDDYAAIQSGLSVKPLNSYDEDEFRTSMWIGGRISLKFL